jgi:hypothetical protein
MLSKIWCDGESENFGKFFWHLNGALFVPSDRAPPSPRPRIARAGSRDVRSDAGHVRAARPSVNQPHWRP